MRIGMLSCSSKGQYDVSDLEYYERVSTVSARVACGGDSPERTISHHRHTRFFRNEPSLGSQTVREVSFLMYMPTLFWCRWVHLRSLPSPVCLDLWHWRCPPSPATVAFGVLVADAGSRNQIHTLPEASGCSRVAPSYTANCSWLCNETF